MKLKTTARMSVFVVLDRKKLELVGSVPDWVVNHIAEAKCPEGGIVELTVGDFYFAVLKQTGYFVCTIGDMPKRQCYQFLLEFYKLWCGEGADEKSVSKNSKEIVFDDRRSVRRLWEWYNDRQNDKMSRIQDAVDATVNVMKGNIEKALQRHEMLEQLDQKAKMLEQTSNQFKRQSDKLYWSEWWRHKKMLIGGGIGVALVTGVVVVGVVSSTV